MSENEYRFDIVVSFAGENRALVSEIVGKCKAMNYSVFYDEDEVAELWGENLVEYFAETYESRARAAIMFISEHYARKAWTTHERRSILQRALNDSPEKRGPYLFPIRIDDTRLPGVNSAIGYVDARKTTPDEIVDFIRRKIGEPMSPPRAPISRTPRTDEECGFLLSERPPLWEHFYTSYLFGEAVRLRSDRFRDVETRFFLPGDFVDKMEVLQRGVEELSKLLQITKSFDALFSESLQEGAWGASGEPGSIGAIEYLAQRYGTVLDLLVEWSERVGGYATSSDEASEYFASLVAYVDQPIGALVRFASDYRDQIDEFGSRISDGEHLEIEFPIAWDIPDNVSSRYVTAREALVASM